jgi:hypothetical protein
MPDEIKRGTTEEVVDNTPNPLPAEPVYTDPVSGEVVQTGAPVAGAPAGYPSSVQDHRVSTYTDDPYRARRSRAYRLQQAIYLVFGIIEALIAIRFVLEGLAANPNAGFAQFIYGITAFFMAPFVGLFGMPHFGTSVFEWSALVAIVIYALLAALLVRLAWLAVGETRQGSITHTESVDVNTRHER